MGRAVAGSDLGELFHLNAVRLQVRSDPVQWAAADGALRAAVTAMAQRLERELAQPHLPQRTQRKCLPVCATTGQRLIRFVDQPDLPMDNNQAERALRGPVVGRKNYYGSGATWSGELTATLFSLFHTLDLWQITTRAPRLTEYLSACAAAGSRVPEDFERFLPWNRRDGQAPRASPALPAPPRAAPRRAA